MAEFIEKQEALDGMRQLPHEYKTKEQRARTGGIAACQMVVKNIEPADVRPVVRGKWIICSDGYYPFCSNCKQEPPGREMTDFCPNCGADMREA